MKPSKKKLKKALGIPEDYINIIVVSDGAVVDNFLFTDNAKAEQCFLEQCTQHISNFDEYTDDDVTAILDNGYENFGQGTIFINHPIVRREE